MSLVYVVPISNVCTAIRWVTAICPFFVRLLCKKQRLGVMLLSLAIITFGNSPKPCQKNKRTYKTFNGRSCLIMLE